MLSLLLTLPNNPPTTDKRTYHKQFIGHGSYDNVPYTMSKKVAPWGMYPRNIVANEILDA